jgi:hypothetical protein
MNKMSEPETHLIILEEMDCLETVIADLRRDAEDGHEIMHLENQTEATEAVGAQMNAIASLVQNGYTCAQLQSARATLRSLIDAC